jgi:hypothetical protein
MQTVHEIGKSVSMSCLNRLGREGRAGGPGGLGKRAGWVGDKSARGTSVDKVKEL